MRIQRIVVVDILVEYLLMTTAGWLIKYVNGMVILKRIATP